MTPDSPHRDRQVYLAAERTFLSWLRTSLAMMGFGFVVARFGIFIRELAPVSKNGTPQGTAGISVEAGTALVFAGVAVAIASMIRYVRMVRRLDSGADLTGPSWLAIAISIGLAAIGLLLAIRLIIS
jgi:putative membrane protein